MGKKKAIPAVKPPLSGKIPGQSAPPAPRHITFSFKYFEMGHKKFSASKCNDHNKYFQKLLERLKALSREKWDELSLKRNKALRIHPIEWNKTSEPDGFSSLPKQLQGVRPWQFSITANEHGRVHGLFLDDVFYIVWLDPAHLLFAS